MFCFTGSARPAYVGRLQPRSAILAHRNRGCGLRSAQQRALGLSKPTCMVYCNLYNVFNIHYMLYSISIQFVLHIIWYISLQQILRCTDGRRWKRREGLQRPTTPRSYGKSAQTSAAMHSRTLRVGFGFRVMGSMKGLGA